MPKKSRCITIKINPYGASLKLYTDRAEFIKALKRSKEYSPDDNLESNHLLGLTCLTNSTFLVGVFNSSLETLVHELTHVCITLLHQTGSLTTANDGSLSDEPLAYLLGWLTNQCLMKLNNTKKDLPLLFTQGL